MAANGTALALRPTVCPICETDRHDRELHPMTLGPDDLSPAVFSARRLPDRRHYRIVRCTGCGLLRSNPILPVEGLAQLYRDSHFTYEAEAAFTRRTYAAALRRATAGLARRERLLEIGCGSGFFLAEARAQGFAEVEGVEPSREAVALAPSELRAHIHVGLYDEAMFPADRFDVVCAFQVLDHMADPIAVLRACRKHLRPGGLALFILHDSGAVLNRLLGERSPIIDVEHVCLFDQTTVRRICEKADLRVRAVHPVGNTYPLGYWAKLAPIPAPLKDAALAFLDRTALARIPLHLRAGNLTLVAEKPPA